MSWALHATRYLRPGSEQLIRVVADDLHYMDFDDALKFYNAFMRWSTDLRDAAFLAANDRFFLLTALLGRRDALHPWLYDRCREVEESPDDHLDLWGREHYKSTLITFAGTIQEVIRDPEITIGIFAHTKGTARKFMSQIKFELENNETLHKIYPDVFWAAPANEAPKWALQDGLTVKRKTNPKEATLEANGLVDGMPTGVHYRLRIYDDLIEEKYVTNPEMVEKATKAWENSDNLGTIDGRKWHVGTRWSFADTYQEIIDKKLLIPRLYPSTHNGKAEGRPVFLPRVRWDQIRRTQSRTLAAQHLQNPSAGATSAFDIAWFKPYEVRPSILNVYILVDPSAGRKKTSDRTAIAVVGVDVGKNKYLLDGYRHRMKLSERWKCLRKLHEKWDNVSGVQHVYVGYETFGQQGADVDQFQEWMVDEGYQMGIEELNKGASGEISKADRVTRLQPDIEGLESTFFFPYPVYYEGLGICKWSYSIEKNQLEYEPIETTEHYRDGSGALKARRTGQYFQTSAQKRAIQRDQPWTIAKPIKQVDESGTMYDLTRAAFEELRYFPFKAGHDDLIDAMSRIYDHPSYGAPVPFESSKIMQPVWE